MNNMDCLGRGKVWWNNKHLLDRQIVPNQCLRVGTVFYSIVTSSEYLRGK